MFHFLRDKRRTTMPMNLFAGLPIHGDVRVKDWPLMQNVTPTVFIVVVYLLSIVFGRYAMKYQKSFQLKHFMYVYNLFQVVVCSYVTFEAADVWIREGYSFLCEPVDYSTRSNAIRAAAACWWFYIMKIVDLIDTLIFVLRKKDNQITFLHVYHHTTMVFFAWYGLKYVAGGQSLFIAVLNSFIHVVMYAYYGLSACGASIQKYLWWKRYLTQAQMIQFVAVIGHSSVNYFTECSFPKIFDAAFMLYGFSVLVLFANFYIQNDSFKCHVIESSLFLLKSIDWKESSSMIFIDDGMKTDVSIVEIFLKTFEYNGKKQDFIQTSMKITDRIVILILNLIKTILFQLITLNLNTFKLHKTWSKTSSRMKKIVRIRFEKKTK